MYFLFDVLSHSTILTFIIFFVFHSTIFPIWHFVPFNVLSHSAFFPFGVFSIQRFFQSTFLTIRPLVPVDVFSIRCFVPFGLFSFDVLSHSAFCLSTICPSTFSPFGVFYFDILSVNPLYNGDGAGGRGGRECELVNLEDHIFVWLKENCSM